MTALASGQKMYGLDTSIPANRAAVLEIISQLNSQVSMGVTLNVTDFPVVVTPTTLPATSPTSVVPGRYLQSFKVSNYDYGYVQVSAVVVIIP